MAGRDVVRGATGVGVSGPCVLLIDGKRTRRMIMASTFRAAGCLVVETAHEHEVVRTLATRQRSWVLVVVDAAASRTLCDAYPTTPIVHLGGDAEKTISGRITLGSEPRLAAQLHLLAAPRGSN